MKCTHPPVMMTLLTLCVLGNFKQGEFDEVLFQPIVCVVPDDVVYRH